MEYQGLRVLHMAKHIKNTVFLFFLAAWSLSPAAVASAAAIQSRAAVVMDAATGRLLYAKNPERCLMPASTTKLMTALVVLDNAGLGDVATVSRRASRTAPLTAGFHEGDKVTIETLLYAALVRSANDAAVVLAEAVAGSEEAFVKLMNMKAIAIGADNTKFINANGLPGKGQYITALDLAKIMRQAIQHPVLREILGTRMAEVSTESGKTIFLKNTNRLLWSDKDIVGGKTGYTRGALHCFVCAGERENGTLIVAVLGTPSRSLLWKESEDLMEIGSKVMNHQEEPTVYLTKAAYSPAKMTRVSHAKKMKMKKSKRKRQNSF